MAFRTSVSMLATAASFAFLAAGPANAQPTPTQTLSEAEPVVQGTGFYATLGLGAGWPQSQSTDFFDPLNARYIYRGGFAGDVGFGYDFGAVRAEITYAFNSNPDPLVDYDGGTLSINGSQVRLNSGYVSAYWDIPITPRIIPYIGGGIGGSNYSFGAGTIDGVPYRAAGMGTFAYQAKVGVSYVVSRQADLFVEGVYQGASGFNIAGESYGPLSIWGAKAGLRWRFAGAPAAVVVAPAPEPTPAPTPAPMVEPAPAPQPAPIRGLW
jgi:opacity protein-like surface antigen